MAVIQRSHFAGLGQNSGGGGSEKWSDSGYILEMGPAAPVDGLDMGVRGEGQLRMALGLGLNNWGSRGAM